MPQLRAAFGLIALIGLAWLISRDRRHFPLKVVLGGVTLQLLMALIVLRTDGGSWVFDRIGELVTVLLQASRAGAEFVFGRLVDNAPKTWGFVFAVQALPTIIVFSSLSAIGYHLGILQRVVGAFARVMTAFMGVSGAESLSAAANIFLGQTEAPLLVRPYIPKMTHSELNAIMVGGFATIAGSLMAVYANMLGHNDPVDVARMAKHLLGASMLSAPASLVTAKLILPERDTPLTAGSVRLKFERTTRNVIDAASSGAADGMKLAINVIAMLIAFIALITLVNRGLVWVGTLSAMKPVLQTMHVDDLSLNTLLGLLFSPIAWLIGLPTADCRSFGSLLGNAMAVNEFIAYDSLAKMLTNHTMSPRSNTLAIYALCGFANFSSIGIQIAGIGGMAPDRYHDLARLGLRAMVGGAIACWMTACVAGMVIP